MNRKMFFALLLLALVTSARAQMRITGYIFTEMEPIGVDSVYFEYGSTRQWFTTPGWNANPGETASFAFPEFEGWPAVIKIVALAAGMPLTDSIYRPTPDSWYSFPPPNDMIRYMFHGEVGIQETPTVHLPGTIATPTLIANWLKTGNIQLRNSLGQVVRSLPLTPGVYFCRHLKDNSVQPVIVVR